MTVDEARIIIDSWKWRPSRDRSHAYVVRGRVEEEDFVALAKLIMEHPKAYQRQFARRTYQYLDIDGYRYWNVGSTNRKVGLWPLEEITVINRAVNE